MSDATVWLTTELLASRLAPGEPLPDAIRWIDLDERLLLGGGRLHPGAVTLPPERVAQLCRWRAAGLKPLLATCTRPAETGLDETRIAALEIDCLTGGCLDAIRIQPPHPIPPSPRERRPEGRNKKVSDPATVERMRGAFLGLAVGDALGAPVENMPAEKIDRLHGRFRDFVSGRGWGPGYPTRETIQALLWFREIADGRNVYDAQGRQRLARSLARWVLGRPRDFGHLTRAILEAYLDSPPIPAARRIWETANRGPEFNAALSRAVAVGIALPYVTELRWSSAIVASVMTHPAPVCIGSALAVTDAVAAQIRGEDPLEASRNATWEERTVRALEQVEGGWSPGGSDWSSQGRSHPLHTLRSALWAVRQAGSFEEILLDLVHRGGDADTHGSIAGALLGARDGASAIPARWLDGLKVRRLVERLIRHRTGTL